MSDEIVHIASMPDSVQVSEIGVTFAGDVSYDDWLRLMSTLTRLEKAVQFAIGDAINYGQHRYGEKYSQAMEATGLSIKALTNYCWVSNSVPIQNRRPGVSWTHHRAVAKLPDHDQISLLRQAEELDWTVDDLKEIVTGKPINPRHIDTVVVPIGITPAHAQEILRQVAKSEGCMTTLCETCPFRM
jgi:hypothetical protein